MKAIKALLIAIFLGWTFVAAADVAVPTLTGRVVDLTGTLSDADMSALTQKLKAFEDRKGSQIAVLIVPTTQPETIEQYSIRVADAWKIGRKKVDDGAILVIAKNDRHLRIEVGYGLEGSLTDATSRRIIADDITPKFKSGDFAGGISAGVDRMMSVVDGEQLPAPERPHWQNSPMGEFDITDLFNPFVLIALVMGAGLLRSILGRLLGSVASGGLVGFLAFLFIGSLGAAIIVGAIGGVLAFVVDLAPGGGPFVGGGFGGGRRGGGWSGGGGWGGSSGGFSGGGGGFGGGGASGSW